MKRQTLTVMEAAALLGIGRAAAYRAVSSGDIPTIRMGRRKLVPRAALDRLLMIEPTASCATAQSVEQR